MEEQRQGRRAVSQGHGTATPPERHVPTCLPHGLITTRWQSRDAHSSGRSGREHKDYDSRHSHGRHKREEELRRSVKSRLGHRSGTSNAANARKGDLIAKNCYYCPTRHGHQGSSVVHPDLVFQCLLCDNKSYDFVSDILKHLQESHHLSSSSGGGGEEDNNQEKEGSIQ